MKKKKTRAAVTISMPQDMAEEYDKLAKRLAKNRSVLFREMFLAYKRQNLMLKNWFSKDVDFENRLWHQSISMDFLLLPPH